MPSCFDATLLYTVIIMWCRIWALRVSVVGWKLLNLIPQRALPIHLFRHFCYRMYHYFSLGEQYHRQTDRQNRRHYHANSNEGKTSIQDTLEEKTICLPPQAPNRM